jgi:hypothetical protein
MSFLNLVLNQKSLLLPLFTDFGIKRERIGLRPNSTQGSAPDRQQSRDGVRRITIPNIEIDYSIVDDFYS